MRWRSVLSKVEAGPASAYTSSSQTFMSSLTVSSQRVRPISIDTDFEVATRRGGSASAQVIGPDDPAYASLLESGSTPNANGNLEFSLEGAALMAPRFDIAPNAYEFRGQVVSLAELNDWIVPEAAIARVTVMRPFEDEDGQPDAEGLDLPILLRKPLLDGDGWPQPGDEVEGIIYVYGSGFAAPFDDDEEGEVEAGVPILT